MTYYVSSSTLLELYSLTHSVPSLRRELLDVTDKQTDGRMDDLPWQHRAIRSIARYKRQAIHTCTIRPDCGRYAYLLQASITIVRRDVRGKLGILRAAHSHNSIELLRGLYAHCSRPICVLLDVAKTYPR